MFDLSFSEVLVLLVLVLPPVLLVTGFVVLYLYTGYELMKDIFFHNHLFRHRKAH